MSQGQWRKLDVVERVERGELTVSEGAQVLGLSRRQMQRLRKKVRAVGAKGVEHGNAGRPPRHKTPDAIRERVLALCRDKYAGFNDQHFTEKLAEAEGIPLSRQTVRRFLREAGIGSVRKRRPVTHRRRRDRRPQAGQMILWDGSRHDWLEGRGPRLCLMGAIDDATGEFLPGAHFVEQECSVGYLRVLRDIIVVKGVPLSAYMDRHGSLRRNDKSWTKEEQLAGRQEPTHVRRALDDLRVQVIYALSPQAKGRVERLWGTLQDRLVSELRLAGANDARSANKVLLKYRPHTMPASRFRRRMPTLPGALVPQGSRRTSSVRSSTFAWSRTTTRCGSARPSSTSGPKPVERPSRRPRFSCATCSLGGTASTTGASTSEERIALVRRSRSSIAKGGLTGPRQLPGSRKCSSRRG